MKTILTVISLSLLGINARAQHIKLEQPLVLDTLIQSNIIFQKARADRQPGYRLQVYFGQDREMAENIKKELLELYPHLKVYLVYDQPNFKLRVGNFISKLEGQEVFAQLREKYPSCFLVPDFIELP